MSDAHTTERKSSPHTGTVIAACITAIAVIIAAVIGKDAKDDKEVAARIIAERDAKIQKLEVQLREKCPSTPELTGAAKPDGKSAPIVHTVIPGDVSADYQRQPLRTKTTGKVLLAVHRCLLSDGSMRCAISLTNTSFADTNITLAIGGHKWSKFDSPRSGSWYVDDRSNEILSSAGGLANREVSCTSSFPCELEKGLVGNAKTFGWVRFDGVDSTAAAIKLLRLNVRRDRKWESVDLHDIPVDK